MENVYYVCLKCSFIHQVPSYWTGHSPEEELEVPHLNLKTREICEEVKVVLEKN